MSKKKKPQDPTPVPEPDDVYSRLNAFCPRQSGKPKRDCPDCFCCQHCSDSRCDLCCKHRPPQPPEPPTSSTK